MIFEQEITIWSQSTFSEKVLTQILIIITYGFVIGIYPPITSTNCFTKLI